MNWDYLQKELENTLQRLVKRELQSSPMLVFILQTETPLFSTNGFTNGKGTENGDRLVNKIKPMLASALSTVTTITLEEKEVSKPEIASTKTYRRKRSTASVS